MGKRGVKVSRLGLGRGGEGERRAMEGRRDGRSGKGWLLH